MSRELINLVRQVTGPLTRRIRMVAGFGLLVKSDDAHPLQAQQFSALDGERFTDAPRVQQFGFSGFAPPNSRLVFVCPGGSRSTPSALSWLARASPWIAVPLV